MNEDKKIILQFLNDSQELIDNIGEVPEDTLIELYDMLNTCAKNTVKKSDTVDGDLHAEVCKRLDLVLDHIVDSVPFEIKADVGIYTPAVQGWRTWKNVELMKDKGLVGYMLGKEIAAKSTMLYCTKPEDYPYLVKLSDMQLEYSDERILDREVYGEYLEKNYEKMDVLILHGMYNETIDFLKRYRHLRPDGKVYCGLDMNKDWMGRIDWADPNVGEFAQLCDIIATSCTYLRDEINRNPLIPFSCRFLPNGFYNAESLDIIADASVKENIIITVGRIGTGQKNNLELMIAFGNVSHLIKNWKLKLIGSIEPEFQTIIDEFFSIRPDLKSRIIFTGTMVEKEKLYKEYAKAKICAFSSIVEGFPNVYAEALFHGCMFLTSDIGAASDITNLETLGITYECKNMKALEKAIVTLCRRANRETMKSHIPKALEYANRVYDWKKIAKKLAYDLLID